MAEATHKTVIISSGVLERIKTAKLDVEQFEIRYDQFIEQLEAIRFAVYDNFRCAKSTDNFIEKYLPFMIQNLISKNVLNMLPEPMKE